MIDFADARRRMVDSQIRPNRVTNLDLLGAMLAVPREAFVPARFAGAAYSDNDVSVTEAAGQPARYLLKPMVLAQLIQAAQIAPSDRVLDVGCATGYSSAVLARLAREVVALEQDAELARRATETLRKVGMVNVTVVSGPLADGWKALAPYNAILVNGAMEIEPDKLLEQLTEKGRVVGIIGGDLAGRAMLYRLDGGQVSSREVFNAAAPALPGFAKPPAFVF